MQPAGHGRELVIAAVATFYTLFLLVAAGPKFILVSFIIYAPASVLFVMARREQGRQLFSPRELLILAVSVIGAADRRGRPGRRMDHPLKEKS